MSSPDQLHIQPADQWYAERENGIELHHPFDGTPLRGHNYDRDASKPPSEFDFNIDWHDGHETWAHSMERTDGDFSVSVLLTDPARPDGLGNEAFLGYALEEYDMIAYAATRSVYHSVRQHGALPQLHGGMPWGSKLGEPRPNPEYQDRLDDLLLNAKRPAFSFDPSFDAHEPARRLVEGVQALRAIAYAEASRQEDMVNPNFAFLVPDLVHANTLQWLQLGIAGLKMQEMADERNNGDLPERLLVLLPVEHSALIYKLGVISGNSAIRADVALAEMREPSYMDDQYMGAYADVLQEGFIEL